MREMNEDEKNANDMRGDEEEEEEEEEKEERDARFL